MITMDFNIVQTILQQSGQDASLIELDNCETDLQDCKLHPRNPQLTSALATSMATLLSHKISVAAHQRYLVRTNLIEQLRDWSRITKRYSQLHSFTDGERTTIFSMNLANKYLTEDLIRKQHSADVLVKLGFALINMKLKNSNFEYKLDNIIDRIIKLERSPDSDYFLDTLSDRYENLFLNLSTIENLYICKAEKLVEIPIVDLMIFFNANYPDLQTIKNHINSFEEISSHSIDKLLKYSSKSPRIFQLLSSILKEILEQTNCSDIVLNFIKFIILYISDCCVEKNNSIIDLYPRNLQCDVILLRIEPKFHTNNSKDYVIERLKGIHSLSKHKLLILLTHFPLWIEEFSKFVPSNSNDLVTR